MTRAHRAAGGDGHGDPVSAPGTRGARVPRPLRKLFNLMSKPTIRRYRPLRRPEPQLADGVPRGPSHHPWREDGADADNPGRGASRTERTHGSSSPRSREQHATRPGFSTWPSIPMTSGWKPARSGSRPGPSPWRGQSGRGARPHRGDRPTVWHIPAEDRSRDTHRPADPQAMRTPALTRRHVVRRTCPATVSAAPGPSTIRRHRGMTRQHP